MTKNEKKTHCRGCGHFWNAGHKGKSKKDPILKYNSWCCANGKSSFDSVGWCKNHNIKKV